MALLDAKRVSILSGLLLLSLAMFVAGLVTVDRDLWLWQKITRVRQLVTALRETGRDMPESSYAPRPDYASQERYTVMEPEAVSPGWLAVTRLDPETVRYVVDLIGADGTLVHQWPVHHERIIPNGKVWEFPHGTTVLPDGSVLVSFNSEPGLARIDGCGDPVWAVPEQVHHHVIQPDDREGYWTWRSVKWGGSHDQVLLRFSGATGQDLETIDLVDDVILPHPATALRMGTLEGFAFRRGAAAGAVPDIFHPNDIEPLPAAIAGAFPQFEAGDLLISLRNLDLIAVLDRETREMLWVQQGPWQQQHDPDWEPDGTISVFNNNRARQRSRITLVNPATGDMRDAFGGAGPAYYTDTMGNHQHLPNGNWLIVAANEGRLLEVTAAGAPVREYNNIVNERYNAVLLHGEYLPPGFFERMPACPGG